MERFASKVAIVTGGASGIGAATVARLASEGAKVMVADMQEPAGANNAARFLKTDVTSPDAVKALVDGTLAAWGSLDILVNNAGTGSLGYTADMEPEEWDRVFAVNTRAVYLGCREAIPHMQENGGAIVNTASISGLLGDYAMTAYNASKGAVVNYTRALALECAQHGIRVNAVCPGLVETPMASMAIADPVDREFWFSTIPLGRAARPEDIAAAIAFLASDDAGYITGVNLAVDGGITAHTGQPNFPVRQRLRAERAGRES